ncbi:uncharacterized protein B0J16DRAFT_349298 [Fusarium flagelliforme]|uniref:uncharacterized protein n=1 Tax=Fusarium flagelliforme TaxID=2675880 RepID=UPI001E8DCF42|nr:uncharacterized protein B0J16DRAFT_349298 [Fusarium flagelliforme]KAH7174871.1 hypothetical protein B0J16DRAFT_349298 [Fusarium flagelliforme]
MFGGQPTAALCCACTVDYSLALPTSWCSTNLYLRSTFSPPESEVPYSTLACIPMILTPSLQLLRVVPVAFSWSLCLKSVRVISLALLSYLPPPRGSSDTTLRRQTVPIDTYRMCTAEFNKGSQIFRTRNYSLTPSVKRVGGQDHVRASLILHRHQRASLRYSLSLRDTVVPLEIDWESLIFMQVILQY